MRPLDGDCEVGTPLKQVENLEQRLTEWLPGEDARPILGKSLDTRLEQIDLWWTVESVNNSDVKGNGVDELIPNEGAKQVACHGQFAMVVV